jgi:hypothetical protein
VELGLSSRLQEAGDRLDLSDAATHKPRAPKLQALDVRAQRIWRRNQPAHSVPGMRLRSQAAHLLSIGLGVCAACGTSDADKAASEPPAAETVERESAATPKAQPPAEAAPTTQPPAPKVDPSARKAALQALAPSQPPLAGFAALPRDADKWRALLAQVPEVAAYAADFTPFTGKEADAALTRGQRSRSTITVWTIADAPFVWRPAPDRELWLCAGMSGDQSLVMVLERKGDDIAHAASTVIAEKDTSIALGYNPADPAELLWTTCYACPGQGGSIRVGDDGRPRFVYR